MKKVALIILDGWGIAEDPEVSAIDKAKTPFYEYLLANFPCTTLQASEEAVGLPEGQMGNSEVGHTNIGAGRIVYQDIIRIAKSLKTRKILENPGFQNLLDYLKTTGKPLHLMGLVSDGGVHSSLEHLKELLHIFKEEGIRKIYLHVFTDGRDTDPYSGKGFVEELETYLKELGIGKIASIVGRYYAMDRDKRWERITKAYDLLVKGKGKKFSSAREAIEDSYKEKITDEFIEPRSIVGEDGKPIALLQAGDAVLFFNFRADRARQLTQVLTQKDFPEFSMKTLPLYYVTMTVYNEDFEGLHVLFTKEELKNTLGEWLSLHNKTQLRIAETEKYPHVTYFFNGGREEAFVGEERILIPSPKVATYDLQPEMSAYEVKDAAIKYIRGHRPDFVCLNFANPDMVGHTGVFEAAVRACEAVDECLAEVVKTAREEGYLCLITADHGNADKMKNPDGSPNTAHTLAKVPFIITSEAELTLQEGVLANIAPTVLALMDLPKPEEMTEESLIISQKIQI